MAKTAYNLHLKGYVGGADLDSTTVGKTLAEQSGKRVNVLIDSLGGSLATGLSISAAFKLHGDVAVHFVGLNASAATIASLGAAHISMEAGAMYLVHKCSTALFSAGQSAFGGYEWGSLNSDQFATLIADCEKIKADLDKLDLNVAQLYARKCRKPAADLLALISDRRVFARLNFNNSDFPFWKSFLIDHHCWRRKDCPCIAEPHIGT